MKKLVSTLLSIVLCLSLCSTALASNLNISHLNNEEGLTLSELQKLDSYFRNMSEKELNAYIDSVALSDNNSSKNTVIPDDSLTKTNLQTAWLAAANIAEDLGYPCSAKLVRSSIYNIDCTEKIDSKGRQGLFQSTIGASSKYQDFAEKILPYGPINYPTLITFNKSENSDLYYSLHTCSAYADLIGSLGSGYKIRIYDTFDFDIDSNYDDLFTTCVNNGAWLCQHHEILNPIDVNIYFLDEE